MNTVEYIRKLESLITDGERIRDDMRRSSLIKDTIIHRQAGELKRMANLNDLLRERRNRAAIRLNVARNETRSMRRKTEKQQVRETGNEKFYDGVKAAAIEMGIWSQLRDEALLRMAGKNNV